MDCRVADHLMTSVVDFIKMKGRRGTHHFDVCTSTRYSRLFASGIDKHIRYLTDAPIGLFLMIVNLDQSDHLISSNPKTPFNVVIMSRMFEPRHPATLPQILFFKKRKATARLFYTFSTFSIRHCCYIPPVQRALPCQQTLILQNTKQHLPHATFPHIQPSQNKTRHDMN